MSTFVTPVRRAHLVAPFGPGSLLLTRNRVSAIVCGPATWLRSLPERPPGSVSVLDELTISDRHLQAATGVDRFVTPWAAGDDPSKNIDWLIPAARFPLMEACANPHCQRMVRRDPADANEGRCTVCVPPTARRGKWPTFQTALILACPAGHVADIDWDRWLHNQPGSPCPGSDLRYQVGASADRPTVSCERCRRSVGFDPAQDFPCGGGRPWLPHLGPEPCPLRSRPTERTSTTVYYAEQLSSLTIPVVGADNTELLHALTDNPVLRALRRLPRSPAVVDEMAAAARRLGIRTDAAQVARHLDALDRDEPVGPSRPDELTALLSRDHPHRPGSLPDLVVEPQDVTRYRGTRLGDLLAAVSLVPRLRETRINAGFSRIEPVRSGPDAGYAQLWGRERPAKFADHASDDWLPGYQVFGEGILLVLDAEAVAAWCGLVSGDPRLDAQAAVALRLPEPANPYPWLLAHTLAHLVMRAAAPQAGYPLPALRERIFAADGRTGLLVYTAAGDVHGTLGGLVELGEPDRFADLLESALDAALWCATDPVCGEDADVPRGRGSVPGACHHCLLVPETSCEAFNHGLDRAAVTGHGSIAGFVRAQLGGAVLTLS